MWLTFAAASRAETIRFLVGEPSDPVHGDSYVLPLSDAAAIAHARQLISTGPEAGASIAVAHIAKGANGINRDYLSPGEPACSWHVTEFDGFYDFTAEILDGWPTFIEGDVDGWIDNTQGMVGFWQYTVIAELPQGDYDADLDVDTADLQAWRADFGGTVDLSADGNGNGVVDIADYVVWRKNLGRSVTLPQQSKSVASVPEASTLHLAVIAASLFVLLKPSLLRLNAWPNTWFRKFPLRALRATASSVRSPRSVPASSLPAR
jgi:hypothetical protein